MTEKNKKQIIVYLDKSGLVILSIFLITLPLLFLSNLTDAFILAKQIHLISTVSILAVLIGVKTVIEGKIKLRSTPFDLPVIFIVITALISSVLAVNRSESLLTAFPPILFVGLLYFATTNIVKTANHLLIILASLTIGVVASSIIAALSFFNIYILPFSYARLPFFNTFGSLLDQAIYFSLTLPITGYFIHSLAKSISNKKKNLSPFESDHKNDNSGITPVTIGFSLAFFVILTGLGATAYQLTTTQKPLILPFQTGFQTAFASISQDSPRMLQGFLFGSGPGTYVTNFTKYKPASYNENQDLWAFTFFRSSSFILETLATMGIVGLLSFIFLYYRIIKERSFFLPIILAVFTSLILPYSFTLIILFFVLLGIFAAIQSHNNPGKYTEIELFVVALKRGLLATRPEGESDNHNHASKKYSKVLPILFLLSILAMVGIPLYFTIRLFISDIYFQRSFVAYEQNNGLLAYDSQQLAINTFPYRDIYHRGFSQTNLALANSLAAQLQANEQEQDVQTQQNILQLVQQAITSARNAAIISPQNAFNWSNLSGIYRNLIGFGENAEQFSLASIQQAIALDPNNPLLYIDMGGIYYQLGQFDDAIKQFQLAISLKNDYANAYYNLGHALEMKGNLQEALAAYQIVKNLVTNDEESLKRISEEIDSLQAKIQNADQQNNIQSDPSLEEISEEPGTTEKPPEPLKINQPGTSLPERDPRVKIPGPDEKPEDSPEEVNAENPQDPTPTPAF